MKRQEYGIDFVVLWVDGNDKEWLKEFNKYAPKEKMVNIDIASKRYRDYGLLRYWFRGVERFAPWVRKVHFVTSGQLPEWLNLDCPKLHWVKHSDFIPADYLPLFSSCPIELYMHKIDGLSEHFVLFNDDFFLTAPVTKDFFFKKGLPCDAAVQNIPVTNGHSEFHDIVINSLYEINKNFNKKDDIRHNFFKWFNIVYGKDNIKNIVLCLWKRYVGFINPHFAQPFLKSSIEDCWAHCEEALTRTMHSRFRSSDDVVQWLFRYWHLCKGSFAPITPYKDKQYFELGSCNTQSICDAIEKGTYKSICINDGDGEDFQRNCAMLQKSFDKVLGEPSSFER